MSQFCTANKKDVGTGVAMMINTEDGEGGVGQILNVLGDTSMQAKL